MRKRSRGAFGGGPDRWKGFLNQDYHGRFTQQLGAGTILLDGYQDNYAINEQKSPTGPQYSDDYHTGGFVASDEFALGRTTFPSATSSCARPTTAGPTVSRTGSSIWVPIASSSRTMDAVAQVLGVRQSLAAAFDGDGRHQTQSAPGPGIPSRLERHHPACRRQRLLRTGSVPHHRSVELRRSGKPESGLRAGRTQRVGSASNPTLVPETGTDLDLSYGHRFNAHTLIQADVYDANEAGALLSGNVVMTPAFAALAPPGYIAAYLNRIRSQCGGTPTLANLGVGTTYNAAGGRYQGVNISATVGIMRNVELSAQYGITSAKYVGIPTDILQNNPTLLDGGQIYGIPFRQGTRRWRTRVPAASARRSTRITLGAPTGSIAGRTGSSTQPSRSRSAATAASTSA